MTEYIKKERAQQLVIDSCNKYHFADDGMLESLAAIDKEPAADVVEVVRCKDCKYFRPWGGQSKLGDCTVCVCEGEDPFTIEETDFCSHGR